MESKLCFVCKKSNNDFLRCGEWEKIFNLDVHYFCLVRNFELEYDKRMIFFSCDLVVINTNATEWKRRRRYIWIS